MRLIKNVVFFCLFCVSASAQDAADIPPVTSQTKIPIPTVCALANFGDPNVPGSPLYSSTTSSLVQDAQGNIYSTSPDGGKFRKGAAYKVTPDGKMTILYDFGQPLKNFPKKDPKDPDVFLNGPAGGLVKYGDNAFIGVSGGGELKVGAIFSIPASGGEPTILYSFRNGIPARKLNPGEKDYTPQEKLDWAAGYPTSAPVAIGSSFYGVTPIADNQNYGIYYGLSGGYAGKYYFKGENGFRPWNLIAGGDGKLYGITIQGTTKATYYMGAVFSASPGGAGATSGGGTRTPVAMAAPTTGGTGQTSSSASGGGSGVKLLYEGGAEGSAPVSLIYASDKQLYVAMANGGKGGGTGLGSIMKFDPISGKHEVIHYFEGYDTGSRPASIVEGPDGKLYGATLGGGHCGGFYSLSKDGKDFKMLFLFDHDRIGHLPRGPLMVDASKKYIYGTTYQMGQHGSGSLYRVDAHWKDEPLKMPGRRPCCALWNSALQPTQGALEIENLKGHIYGAMGQAGKTDKAGYVYTTNAGLIDIGHLRDMADMTRYVYEQIMGGEHSLTLYEGTVEVKIPKAELTSELAMLVAGAITYSESWAHEITTWGDPLQDFSSFSPEDNISNMLGIFVGRAAVQAGCNFDAAMDQELPKMLTALAAQPAAHTKKVLEAITAKMPADDKPVNRVGKWVVAGFPFEKLLRRNFYGRVWLVPPELPKSVPKWLNASYFSPHNKYFVYTMKNKVRMPDGKMITVTHNDMTAVTEMFRETWLKNPDNKGMDTWP